MLLQVYSHRFSPWLIVNGQPSQTAVDAFGLLRLEGSFQADRLTDPERTLVMREMSSRTYACVPSATARRLMAHSPIRLIRHRLTRWFAVRPAPQSLA